MTQPMNGSATDTLRHTGRIVARWILWSPRHIVAAVVIILVVLFGFGSCAAHHTKAKIAPMVGITAAGTPSLTPTTGVTSSTPRATPTKSPVPTTHTSVATSVPVKLTPTPVLVTGVTFTRAWLLGSTFTGGAAKWVKTLQPYVTTRLLAELKTVDPRNVPITHVTDAPVQVASADGRVLVQVPAGRYVVAVQLVNVKTHWLVDVVDVA